MERYQEQNLSEVKKMKEHNTISIPKKNFGEWQNKKEDELANLEYKEKLAREQELANLE